MKVPRSHDLAGVSSELGLSTVSRVHVVAAVICRLLEAPASYLVNQGISNRQLA